MLTGKVNRRLRRALPLVLLSLFVYALTVLYTPRRSLIYMQQKGMSLRKPHPVFSGDNFFDTSSIRYIPEETIMQTYKSMIVEKPDEINWDRFAYVFYATGPTKLFPLLVNVRQLRKMKIKAKIHVICSFNVDQELEDKNENLQLVKQVKLLREKYAVQLEEFNVIKSKFSSDSTYWADSFTKFHAFSLTQYDRVIYMDSDSIIRKRMDQLFFLPPALLAAPLDYSTHPPHQRPKVIESLSKLKNLDDLPPTLLEYTIAVKDTYNTLIGLEQTFGPEFFWSLYATLPSMESALDLFPKMRLASYVMVIMPDKSAYDWICKVVDGKGTEEYDMEVINHVWKMKDLVDRNQYTRTIGDNSTVVDEQPVGVEGEQEEGKSKREEQGEEEEEKEEEESKVQNQWLKSTTIPSLLLIPHAPYTLLSGEFRQKLTDHSAYLAAAPDYGYLTEPEPMLSIQRALKNGVSYRDIGDVVESYPEVPYWDWAWRFDFEGNAEPVKELQLDIDIDKLIETKEGSNTGELLKRDENDVDLDNEEITTGMGVDKFGWDGKKIAENAVYIHWSDWPLPKPWEFESDDPEEMADANEVGGTNWIFSKLAEEALLKCTQEAEDIFSSIDSKQYSKVSQLLEKERKFAVRVCEESVEAWKGIYREYRGLMKQTREEINSA